ncbi:hypothetical protein KEM54_002282 [Ascosphaera aggregata]|nr:hypothetical protein KEM54_002282 [Ascosphaera aggregata]
MRSSILACAVLAGVSLAQSSTSGAALDNGFQTAHITVYPDACSAQHPGPEFVLPPAITAVSSEEPLSFTTITTTSTHVVWMTEDKKSDETASETSISVPLIAYAPFTPPIAPLSCDDAPTLTYISETVFETLPATTVTTTSVSTTTELVDHDFYSTSYVYVTPSQTPVTVTATATVTASPSLSTVMITDSVIVIHNVTVTASPERVSVTITETESASASRTMGAVLTSGLSKSMGTTLNIVPVDSFSGEKIFSTSGYDKKLTAGL